jgi:hypothetical protein
VFSGGAQYPIHWPVEEGDGCDRDQRERMDGGEEERDAENTVQRPQMPLHAVHQTGLGERLPDFILPAIW